MDRSRIRLAAANGLLNVCAVPKFGKHVTMEHFQQLAFVMQVDINARVCVNDNDDACVCVSV